MDENESENEVCGDHDSLAKAIRKYRKKLRQIERLETTAKELSAEEKAKLMKRDFIRSRLQSSLAELSEMINTSNDATEKEYRISEATTSTEADLVVEEQAAIASNMNIKVEPTEQFDFNNDREDFAGEDNVTQPSISPPKAAENQVACKKKTRKPKSRLRKAWKNKQFQVSVLEGHNDKICDVAIDRDWIVSASRDTSVKLWNASTGEEMRNLTGHSRAVTCVRLIDEPTSDCLRKCVKIDRGELACDLSRKSESREQLLITASSDCSIRLWLLPKGNLIKSFYNYSSVRSICFEAGIIFAGSDSGKITVYSVLTGTPIYERIICDEPITSLKCAGSRLVATTDFGQLFVWEIFDEKGEEKVRVTQHLKSFVLKQSLALAETDLFVDGRQMLSSCFIPWNKEMLFVGDDGVNLKLIDLRTGFFSKFPNHFCGRAGFTDVILVTQKLIFATALDADSGKGSINVRSLEDDAMFAYVATLTDPCLDRIVCADLDATSSEGGEGLLKFVTGGNQLLSWVEISAQENSSVKRPKSTTDTHPQVKTEVERENDDSESEMERIQVKSSYVAELTRAPVDSDVESESSDDEDGGAWFWTKKSTTQSTTSKNTGESAADEGSDDDDDSDVMTSSGSENELITEEDGAWRWWCSIL